MLSGVVAAGVTTANTTININGSAVKMEEMGVAAKGDGVQVVQPLAVDTVEALG